VVLLIKVKTKGRPLNELSGIRELISGIFTEMTSSLGYEIGVAI